MTLMTNFGARFFSASLAVWILQTAPLLLTASDAAAQSSVGNGVVSNCMTRTNADGSKVNVLVPQDNQPAMQAEGYQATPCGSSLGNRDAQRKWRDEICTIAATSGESTQRAVAALVGARPAVLCGMAERVIGSWEQRPSS